MSRLAQAGSPRAGMLACICDPQFDLPANDNSHGRPNAVPLALGFAFAVLAQTLASGILPIAGAMLAPRPVLATLPFAAMMLGAALASFPASFLGDAFGRRTGFALGASLGIAGGAVLALGLLQRQFAFACLGALWLGMAQGFSFFYRHEAAASAGRPAAATAGVMAGGLLAALVGPTLASFSEALFSPFLLVGSAVLAALAHTASLGVAVRLAPDARPWIDTGAAGPLKAIVAPTLLGMLAWFGMSLVMASAPLALMDCGVAEGAVFGFIALHVAAMYAPAVPLALLGRYLKPQAVAAGGTLLVLLAYPLQHTDATGLVTAALILVGAGWSAATVGCTAWLHQSARPGRLALALHDGALFSAAILGAALAGRFF
ncbi:hypothetical protein DFO45_3796 [Azorhizobium sp. AG788]|uniref:hypothetical protein n=1 Tax=Azorhizobium sp. AG788 TaxID=2183897 RepID=UPI00105B4D5D|nr:hypothetical protein [Azorhizobium sp. AG788]TDT91241.1 hypothetical protein DFO45_3796 [Azorhizobium sp. AG788]